MRDRHYRRNFLALLGDTIGFGLFMTFASSTTTLPDFAAQLTDSEAVVGLLTTVGNAAWLLPQMFYARFLSNKRRKKRYVTLAASIGRPAYLLYAVGLWLGLHRNPGLALFLLFVLQAFFLGSDALATVAWFDVMSKAIPEDRRARLIGVGQVARGLLGIAAGQVITLLLSQSGPPFPHNYAAVFTLAAGCLFFSLASWSFVVEPDRPVEEERLAWRDYLPRLVGTLRRDQAFRRLIIVRLLHAGHNLALNFYILFARRELGLSAATVGVFTTVQTVGGILASIFLGFVSERIGNHRVIQITTGLCTSAPLVGLAISLSGVHNGTMTVVIFSWIFLMIGVFMNAFMLGFFNYLLDLAPPGEAPTYVGLFNTSGSLLIVLPGLGGALLAGTSYSVLFAVTAAIVAAGHLLSWGLPSPRQPTTALQEA